MNYYGSMGRSITPLIREKYAFFRIRHENMILKLIFTG